MKVIYAGVTLGECDSFDIWDDEIQYMDFVPSEEFKNVLSSGCLNIKPEGKFILYNDDGHEIDKGQLTATKLEVTK